MKHNWEYKKLGEVCETTSGGTPSKIKLEYYTNGNIPWLRSGEIRQGLIFDTDIYITEEGLKHSSAKIIPINSVVIAMYGATVGQCGIIKSKMCTNQAVCSIFPNSNIIPEFLCLFLTSKKNTFIKSAVGGAQPNISQNIVRNTLIPLPPLSVQERIVEELDRLSLILEKKKQQIKELDSLAQSIFYDMFGDPIENEKDWEVRQLKNIAALKNGLNYDKVNKGYNVKILSVSDFQNNKVISSTDISYTIVSKEIDENFYLRDNDLIFVRSNGSKSLIGRCVLINTLGEAISFSGFCIRCRITSDCIIPQYVLSFMQNTKIREQLTGGGRGCNIQNINQQNLGNQLILLPPLDMQQSFAKKIEAIEKQKELINQSIKEVQLLFDAKMDYYFGD